MLLGGIKVVDGLASDCPDAEFGACGGGILVEGGTLVLILSEVSHNAALSQVGSAGGGIMSLSSEANPPRLVIFVDNISSNQADMGGGIYISPDADFTAISSLFLENSANQQGGAIYNAGIGLMYRPQVANSTFTGNSAGQQGGAIYNANFFDASMELDFLTVAGNSAQQGGGIYSQNGGNGIYLAGTILSGNTSGNCNDGTNITSLDYNISSDATCSSGVPGENDLENKDPLLGVLGNYGGPTQSIPLLTDSPAIDGGGDCAGFIHYIPVDQRLVTRPIPSGGLCDAGAFEYDPVLLVAGSAPVDGQSLTAGPASLQVTFNKDPLNDGSTDSVTSLSNYNLVERGVNAFFDTASCRGGARLDDVRISIDSVTYNASTKTASLSINDGKPLTNGVYRLFVCGTTSMMDEYNLKLNYGNSDSVINFTIAPANPPAAVIPATGFAVGRNTWVPLQPAAKAYSDLGDLWLEIPRLGVKIPIVGVPLVEGAWDISWLGQNAGWLNGSAYPTWKGNSVITGHVWNANDTAGPFAYLNSLSWDDRIVVHAGGASYIYALRGLQQVSPGSVAAMLKHEDRPWLTLVSCRGYDPRTNSYKYRLLARAVLIEVK